MNRIAIVVAPKVGRVYGFEGMVRWTRTRLADAVANAEMFHGAYVVRLPRRWTVRNWRLVRERGES